jgi:NADH-quinone oxidoreductase subunit L
VGALALAGIFPLSGFFSKEAILGVLAGNSSKIWLFAGLTGAFLTAYYSFRLIFFMLFPKAQAHAHGAAHDSGHGHGGHNEHGGHTSYVFWCMAVPVMILASVTLVLGFAQSSLEHFLVPQQAAHAAAAHGEGHGVGHVTLLAAAVSMALAGIILAYFEFGRKGAKQEGFLRRFPKAEELFARRWYMDDMLRTMLDNLVYKGFTNLFTRNDRRIIDGGIDGFCRFTIGSGRVTSFMQSGMLQYNLLIMIAAVGFILLYFFLQ